MFDYLYVLDGPGVENL